MEPSKTKLPKPKSVWKSVNLAVAILSSEHSFHDDIPVENVFAMIETVKKYGVY